MSQPTKYNSDYVKNNLKYALHILYFNSHYMNPCKNNVGKFKAITDYI